MSDEQACCGLCGEPMPAGEEMFKFHGYSGPCPKPPKPVITPKMFTASEVDAITKPLTEEIAALTADLARLRERCQMYEYALIEIKTKHEGFFPCCDCGKTAAKALAALEGKA